METSRAQRRSDGTFTVGGIRFEVPTRYRSLLRVTVRVARWDLSTVDLVDPRSGAYLCPILPLDKQKNADRMRRPLPLGEAPDITPLPEPSGIAPRLRALMEQYAATGLPPAYVPKDESRPVAPITQINPEEEDRS